MIQRLINWSIEVLGWANQVGPCGFCGSRQNRNGLNKRILKITTSAEGVEIEHRVCDPCLQSLSDSIVDFQHKDAMEGGTER